MDGKSNFDTPNIDHKNLKPGWYWAKYYLDECFICVEVKTGKHRLFIEEEANEEWTYPGRYEFICSNPSPEELEEIKNALVIARRYEMMPSDRDKIEEALKLLRG